MKGNKNGKEIIISKALFPLWTSYIVVKNKETNILKAYNVGEVSVKHNIEREHYHIENSY